MSFKLQLSESAFQNQIEGLANQFGWSWLHIERALNDRGYWRTPIRGELGRGWPDLVLVKGSRLLFVELKANGKHPTELQRNVLGLLGHIPGAEIYVWHPDQWADALEILSA